MQRMDEGGRSVRFWEVETPGVDLKGKVGHGDRHCCRWWYGDCGVVWGS